MSFPGNYYYFENLLENTICTTLSSETVTPSNIICYPNPTTAKITIEGTMIEAPFEVAVYNTLGQLLVYQCNEKELDLSSFDSGPYILKITRKTDVYTQKIIKK